MSIRSLDVYRLSLPFRAARAGTADRAAAFNAASAAYTKMETLLVKVTLDSGVTGWGEAFGHASNAATAAVLRGDAGRFFIGQSARSPASLSNAARRAFHSYGQTGPFVYALSAVDIALWDIAAQVEGVPLFEMLGGQGDGVVQAYASLVSYGNDPARVAEEAARAHAAGFSAIKLHETAFDAVAAAKRALPASVDLMVDVNCAWQEDEAAATLGRWRELELGFVEEPLWPVGDYRSLSRLREQGVRIAAGENVAGLHGAKALIESGAVDVFQPSVAKLGGITAVREAIAIAEHHDVRVLPHCFYYGPGLLATAHIAASLEAPAMLEIPYLTFEALLHPAMEAKPRIALSRDPGLGFVPDRAVLERYLAEHFSVE